MFAVGLWHLFEQQLADFVRHAILHYPADLTENPNFDKVEKHLRGLGIDIARFSSQARLHELRRIANCAKHGDGPSCSELRILRPDLFSPFPHEADASRGFWGYGPAIAPLGGEHLYLTADDLKSYAETIKTFWTELSAEVRSLVTRRDSSEPGTFR